MSDGYLARILARQQEGGQAAGTEEGPGSTYLARIQARQQVHATGSPLPEPPTFWDEWRNRFQRITDAILPGPDSLAGERARREPTYTDAGLGAAQADANLAPPPDLTGIEADLAGQGQLPLAPKPDLAGIKAVLDEEDALAQQARLMVQPDVAQAAPEGAPPTRRAPQASIAALSDVEAAGGTMLAELQADFDAQPALRKVYQSVRTGARNAPGVLGSGVRAVTDDTELERLIEGGQIDLSKGQRAALLTATFAPVLGEILLAKGAARALAPRVGGRGGDLLNVMGRIKADSRIGGAATGVLEGLATDLAQYVEDNEEKYLGLGVGLGAVMGAMFPGGQVADDLVDAIKADPVAARDGLQELVAQSMAKGNERFLDLVAQGLRNTEDEQVRIVLADVIQGTTREGRNLDAVRGSAQADEAMDRYLQRVKGKQKPARTVEDVSPEAPQTVQLDMSAPARKPRATEEPVGIAPPDIDDAVSKAHAEGGGGSTVDPRTGKSLTDDTWLVAVHDGDDFVGDASRESVAEFRRRYAEDLAKPGRYIGTWERSPGQVVYDVVEAIPDEQRAVRVAAERNQDAIFNPATRAEITTRGGIPDGELTIDRRQAPRRGEAVPVEGEQRVGDRRTTDRRRRTAAYIRALRAEARQDVKTGLQNQNAFERARPRIDADPNQEWVGIDVRNFKLVNDRISYAAGDDILRMMAEKLRGSGIPVRNLFRRGGDEFAVAVEAGQGETVAKALRDAFGTQSVEDFEVSIRTGVGGTIDQADEAMAAAKKLETGPRYRDTTRPPTEQPETVPPTEPQVAPARTVPEVPGASPLRFGEEVPPVTKGAFRSAGVVIGDQVVEGPSHAAALAELERQGFRVDDLVDDLGFGFVDRSGNYFDSYDVGLAFGTATSEGMTKRGFLSYTDPSSGTDTAVDITERVLREQRAARAAEAITVEGAATPNPGTKRTPTPKSKAEQIELFSRVGLSLGLGGASLAASDSDDPGALEAGLGAVGLALLGGASLRKVDVGTFVKGWNGKRFAARIISPEEARALGDNLSQDMKARAALHGYDDPEAYGAVLIWRGKTKGRGFNKAIRARFGSAYKIDYDKLYDKSAEFYQSRVAEAFDSKAGIATFQEVEQAIERGVELGGAKWYKDVFPTLARLMGEENARVFTRLLGATSPQADAYTANITFAKQAFLEHRLLGSVSPEGARFIGDKKMNWVIESARAGLIGDRKINSYINALMGDENVTVNDMWLHRLFGFGQLDADKVALGKGRETLKLTNAVTPTQYRFIEEAIRDIAKAKGITPAEAQAAAWIGVKDLWEDAMNPKVIRMSDDLKVSAAGRRLTKAEKTGDVVFEGRRITGQADLFEDAVDPGVMVSRGLPPYAPALENALRQDPAFLKVAQGIGSIDDMETAIRNAFNGDQQARMLAAVRAQVAETVAKAVPDTKRAINGFVDRGLLARGIVAPFALGTVAAVTTDPATGADHATRFAVGASLALAAGVAGPVGFRLLDKASGGALRASLFPGGKLLGRVDEVAGSAASSAVRKAMVEMKGTIAEADRIIRQNMGDLAAVTRKLYGSAGRTSTVLLKKNPLEGMPAQVVADIDAYMRGDAKALSNLPPEMVAPVVRMRQAMDDYSRAFVSEGIVEQALGIKFTAQLGAYLNRSYRAFDVPDWAKSAPDILGEQEWLRIQNQFRQWYRQTYDPAGKLSADEVDTVMRDFINVGDDGNVLKSLASGRLGRLNAGILAGRKDVPFEVRQLWGEHTDPGLNFIRTLSNQAHYLGTYRFLSKLKEVGVSENFFFDASAAKAAKRAGGGSTARPAGLDFPVAGPGSETLKPLADVYTTREIRDALQAQFETTRIDNPVINALLTVGSLSKVAKTVGSQVTQVRNLTGNTAFAMAQGYLVDVPTMLKGARDGFRAILAGTGLSENLPARDFFNKLARLGVVDDAARAEELRAALSELSSSRFGDWLRKYAGSDIARSAGRKMAAIGTAGTELYRAEDDIWKTIAFAVERNRYAKALGSSVSPDELDSMAAEVVRLTWPTFSEVPDVVQKVRRIGGFISFPAEVFRAAHGTLRLIERELADPKLRGLAAKRIAGSLATITGGAWAAAAVSRKLYNVTRDDEWAVREFQPAWSENSVLVHLGKPADGKFRVFDASYTDPFSYMHAPLVALMRGEDWRETLMEVTAEVASPWVSLNPFTSELLEEIKADEDNGWKMVLDATVKSVTPGIIDQYTRAITGKTAPPTMRSIDRGGEWLSLVTGVRAQEVDVRLSLAYAARAFKDGLNRGKVSELDRAEERGYSSRLPDWAAEFNPLVNSIDELRSKAYKQQVNAWREMMNKVDAAHVLGISRREINQILKDARVNEADRNKLLDGVQ